MHSRSARIVCANMRRRRARASGRKLVDTRERRVAMSNQHEARSTMTDGLKLDARPVTGRVVILGGTGFVGSHLRTALGSRPVRLVVRDPERHANVASATTEVVGGDITDAHSL